MTSSSDNAAFDSCSRPRLAVLDSGVGGLPYLDWIQRRRPDGAYLYLADTAGFPYGSRTAAEITELVSHRVAAVAECFDPDIFLIACNTASVVALGVLRQRFAFPFVGVVPAVKPAAIGSRARSIGLIATSGTVVHGYTDGLISEFASDCAVHRFDGQALVEFIENDYSSAAPDRLAAALDPAVRFFRAQKVDRVVLGCTHYLHVKDAFQRALGSDIEVIDSVEGVGRQVLRRLDDSPRRGPGRPCYSIFTSGGERGSSYADFAARYGALYGGIFQCP